MGGESDLASFCRVGIGGDSALCFSSTFFCNVGIGGELDRTAFWAVGIGGDSELLAFWEEEKQLLHLYRISLILSKERRYFAGRKSEGFED
jgi:hypothetical protein